MTIAREERLVVSPDESGHRLDIFLTKRLPDLSRSQVQRLIKSEHVTINDTAAKPGWIVDQDVTVVVRIPEPAPATPQPENLALSILHDDPDFVVIDKPAGIVVHPGAGHAGGTLVNALLHHVRDLSGVGGELRPGIVHRLDRGTSGVMVVAKNDRAHRELSRQFHDREVIKEYVALIWGAIEVGHVMDQPIGRDPNRRVKMSGRARVARAANTTVVNVEALNGVSFVRVRIGTGRTHQIRVHLSEAGHPIVGDELYGGVHRRVPPEVAAVGRLTRPFLHSARIEFTTPQSGDRVSVEAQLPRDLAGVLTVLRRVREASAR